jgi:hypothetical protein
LENTGNENFSQDLKDNEENRLSLHAVGQKKAYRLALFAMMAFSIVIVCVFSLAFVPPQFYQSVINSGSEEPSTAGRFVTQIASATNEIQQGKNWGISVRENEINAWLGNDLPRNHPELLGNALWGRLSRPRIKLEPHLLRIGIEVSRWGVPAVAWADIEVRLKSVNQFTLTVQRAGVGQLPLPRNAVLQECSKTLKNAGIDTDIQRYRDRMLLLATIPQRLTNPPSLDKESRQPQRWQVDSLRIDRGSVTVAGTSRTKKNSHAFSEAMP